MRNKEARWVTKRLAKSPRFQNGLIQKLSHFKVIKCVECLRIWHDEMLEEGGLAFIIFYCQMFGQFASLTTLRCDDFWTSRCWSLRPLPIFLSFILLFFFMNWVIFIWGWQKTPVLRLNEMLKAEKIKSMPQLNVDSKNAKK